MCGSSAFYVEHFRAMTGDDTEGSAPAGWYADPEVRGMQRYWDGAAWTEHTAAKARRRWPLRPWRWQEVAIALVLIVGLWLSPGFLVELVPGHDQRQAKGACRDEILEAAPAPSTTEFSEEQVVEGPEDHTYEVNGAVDSENGFGTMVRVKYSCLAEQRSGNWRATVEFLGAR
jgi:hypothetical protein